MHPLKPKVPGSPPTAVLVLVVVVLPLLITSARAPAAPLQAVQFLARRKVAHSLEQGSVNMARTTILGYFSSSLPDSNEPLCVLNRQRELALPRLTAAPTATSSAYILTLQFLWRQAYDKSHRHEFIQNLRECVPPTRTRTVTHTLSALVELSSPTALSVCAACVLSLCDGCVSFGRNSEAISQISGDACPPA